MTADPDNGTFPADLSQPALRALHNAGYTRLEQLDGVDERSIAKLHGMGPKGIRTLRAALAERDMGFSQQ